MSQSILSHRFQNGLCLIAEPMDWLESAAFNILLPSGCSRDPEDRLGLSNFTCEMVQRGCGARDSRQFVEDLENLGANHGGSVAAPCATFGGAMPADNLFQVLAIYADLLRHPHLPEDQLEDGRLVCLHEIRALEDDLAQRVINELRQRQYPYPLGRASQGTIESVQRIQRSDIQQFYQQTYQPSGAILAVAGKIDWQRLRDHVGQLLGDWQPQPTGELHLRPAQRGRLHIPYDSSQTHIAVAFPSVPYSDPDYFQARGAVGVLSDGMSSRLFTQVREERGLCYAVYASCHSLKDYGSILCYAGTSSDRAQQTLDVLLAELVRLGAGIEAEELERLKVQVRSRLIMEQESSRARAAAIALDWYYLDRVRSLQEVNEIINQLSVKSINAYLADHPPGDFCIVTLGRQLETT